MNGFMKIESELQRRRAQRESVEGKDCPFRVEYRYQRGTHHYEYFETYKAALNGQDLLLRYSVFGEPIIESPSSKQIQKRGIRGGWSKYSESAA